MNQGLLLKTALITAILGMIAITLIAKLTNLEEMNIGQARQADEGAMLKITGVVEKVTSQEGFSVISIKKEETISVVLYDSINLSKGQKVEVTGKTKEYQGSTEIIADTIMLK